MEKFIVHAGVAAPLLRANIDTDAIIPSREMKRVSKRGLGDGLFAGWRYTEAGGRMPTPEFVLNQPAYKGCSILLAGTNFGCGSSREHAVWALREFGIRAIIAPGFGSIFFGNCTRNGILPVVLADSAVAEIARQVQRDPQRNRVLIDLQQCHVIAPQGETYDFALEAIARDMLLEGLDPIALTLKMNAQIQQFRERRRQEKPWLSIQ